MTAARNNAGGTSAQKEPALSDAPLADPPETNPLTRAMRTGGDEPLISARALRVEFASASSDAFRRRTVRVVDDVDLDVHEGESVGLVGESGCGKTTTGRALMRLIEPTAGEIRFRGENLRALSRAALRRMRRHMQIVFQDPVGSLDPRMTIERIVAEPMECLPGAPNRRERRRRIASLLERVGLPADALDRRPHAFSGGQRQRIAIARAIATEPSFIVLDEPTSALDVSVQAQILNLLRDLQRDLRLAYLFISHDLGVVRHMCDRIAVMKDGRILEIGSRDDVIDRPRHEYTKRLLDAVPEPPVSSGA
jgi:peptide/nickel transport system ATP-binding protein